MESTGEKSVVRSRRTDGHARFEMRHVRWSACRAFALATKMSTYRGSRDARDLRDATSDTRSQADVSRRVAIFVPTTLHLLPRSQALVNCGHVYHLSCIHRWFNCKKDAASERRGGRRAPPHAPCPKC
jgi:hypothetical protein